MNIQYISDDSGNKTHVVLPVADYESLIDNRDFDMAMADDGEVFPESLVSELLEATSKLKVWRKYRGLTQQQLGEKVGVSKEYISLLEAGKRAGTLDIQKNIAMALNIDLDDLI